MPIGIIIDAIFTIAQRENLVKKTLALIAKSNYLIKSNYFSYLYIISRTSS